MCPECGTFITAPEGVGEEPPDESAASADGGWRFLGGAFGFFAGFLWMAFLIALAAGLVVGALVLVARGSGP